MRKHVVQDALCNTLTANYSYFAERRCGGRVPHQKLSTEELANVFRVVPQTIRAGFCRKGNYLGLVPLKLPNGKLLWDASEVESLLSGGGV